MRTPFQWLNDVMVDIFQQEKYQKVLFNKGFQNKDYRKEIYEHKLKQYNEYVRKELMMFNVLMFVKMVEWIQRPQINFPIMVVFYTYYYCSNPKRVFKDVYDFNFQIAFYLLVSCAIGIEDTMARTDPLD
jgi:hypothetical protein